jgi:acyl-CoA thioesterase-1
MVKILSIAVVVVLLAGAVYFFFVRNNTMVTTNTINDRSVASDGVTVITFGDSLTSGYGLPINESYPAQLSVALKAQGKQVEVINAGVSGETTRGNLERAEFIRSQNPDIVLLGIGGNDALRALPVSDTKANILKTVEILKSGENPPVVVLLRMQSPLNAGLRYKQEFDALYEEVAESQDTLLLPFVTLEIFLNQENKLQDGIHLNKVGYGKVVEQYLLKPVIELIEQIEGQ